MAIEQNGLSAHQGQQEVIPSVSIDRFVDAISAIKQEWQDQLAVYEESIADIPLPLNGKEPPEI